MEIEVKDYTGPQNVDWYSTWERTAEGWGVLVVAGSFFFPGLLTISWPNGKPSFPPREQGERIERKVDIELRARRGGQYVVFDNLPAAEAYTHAQATKIRKKRK